LAPRPPPVEPVCPKLHPYCQRLGRQVSVRCRELCSRSRGGRAFTKAWATPGPRSRAPAKDLLWMDTLRSPRQEVVANSTTGCVAQRRSLSGSGLGRRPRFSTPRMPRRTGSLDAGQGRRILARPGDRTGCQRRFGYGRPLPRPRWLACRWHGSSCCRRPLPHR